ncbi:hypothetical protein GCM10023217_32030 [Gordonia alkaliphila]|uniref:Uncharacterized protein n=1 Tax=Gordonia alkaliphila TaxID=1053547 RepID=A0ABP8ZIC7_9ACTN
MYSGGYAVPSTSITTGSVAVAPTLYATYACRGHLFLLGASCATGVWQTHRGRGGVAIDRGAIYRQP